MSFFTGFGVSSVVYVLLNYIFPVPGPGMASKFREVNLSEEDVYDETTGDDHKKSDDEKHSYVAEEVREV